MSDPHHHHILPGRKEKYCCIVARNKRHHLINLMAWEHEANTQKIIEAQDQKGVPTETGKAEGDNSWTERADKVLNRLTGKRRKAKGRWSGFAGSSGGPSKGR